MVNVYSMRDIDTNEIYLEGTTELLEKYGYNKNLISAAARTGRLCLGKYKITVINKIPKVYKRNPNPVSPKKKSTHKMSKSNLKVIAEISKKAAEQQLSYGQYQAKERKIKTTFDVNRGCWKEIEIG